MAKSYTELISIQDYEERYRYLKQTGTIGDETFGGRRWLNQVLYRSPEWKRFRKQIILRDSFGGDYPCDMAFKERPIMGQVIIHHINPLTVEDIKERSESIFDPENVICVSHQTHEAIHYGDENLLIHNPVVRTPGDTCPWR